MKYFELSVNTLATFVKQEIQPTHLAESKAILEVLIPKLFTDHGLEWTLD